MAAAVNPPASPAGRDDAWRAQRDAQLANWLAGAAGGDSRPFERFYDATVGYARALARRIVDSADLDDALADAYLDAWRRVAKFDPDRGSAVTWLLTIVHSRALDLRRRRAVADAGQNPVDDGESTAGDDDPGERLWRAQRGQRLHAALARLSAQERWVLALAYFRDQSHQAIAEATGLPLGTVKSLIHRAHGKLRAGLETLS